jgi:hypothetical protein
LSRQQVTLLSLGKIGFAQRRSKSRNVGAVPFGPELRGSGVLQLQLAQL